MASYECCWYRCVFLTCSKTVEDLYNRREILGGDCLPHRSPLLVILLMPVSAALKRLATQPFLSMYVQALRGVPS
jgi:hypothetical protein